MSQFANPERDDSDVHIFVRWDLILSCETAVGEVGESIRATNDLVSRRANSILENSDSVLVLGKDTGPSLDLLKQIAARLETHGYFTCIIKEAARSDWRERDTDSDATRPNVQICDR